MDGILSLMGLTLASLLLSTVGLYSISRMQSGPILRLLQEPSVGPIVNEVALFIFMVGIPFAGLITGAVRVDLMALGADLSNPNHLAGFTFANWVREIGVGIAVCMTVLLVIGLSARSFGACPLKCANLITLRDALYDEMHWSFYRAAPALLFNDVYSGVIIGVILVFLELAISPGRKFANAHDGNRHQLTLRLACLLTSGFLYLATQNLYVMIAVHLAVGLVGCRLLSWCSNQSVV